jgi:17beta-estradiol 17-dehydrogenase / very-long-chain 3-oxoacyl-CoA reductase
LILNVGSFAALTSSPLLAPYAGSKSFLYAWSQALGAEYEKRGISVQLLNTFFVVGVCQRHRLSLSSFPAAGLEPEQNQEE